MKIFVRPWKPYLGDVDKRNGAIFVFRAIFLLAAILNFQIAALLVFTGGLFFTPGRFLCVLWPPLLPFLPPLLPLLVVMVDANLVLEVQGGEGAGAVCRAVYIILN